jgi:hypothetical protein
LVTSTRAEVSALSSRSASRWYDCCGIRLLGTWEAAVAGGLADAAELEHVLVALGPHQVLEVRPGS